MPWRTANCMQPVERPSLGGSGFMIRKPTDVIVDLLRSRISKAHADLGTNRKLVNCGIRNNVADR